MDGNQEFASSEIRVFTALAKAGWAPSIVFDIGAANGTWSDLVNNVFPNASFHLFEPLADLIPEYQDLLPPRMEKHESFKLHVVALGNKSKRVKMSVHPNGYSSTTLDMGDHPDFQRREYVDQYRLDEYVERLGLPFPELMKLDTQGSELAILSESSRCLEHASLVFVETWFERGYGPETPLITDLYSHLARYGYQLAELGHLFYNETHCLYGCDAFFLKRALLEQVARMMPANKW